MDVDTVVQIIGKDPQFVARVFDNLGNDEASIGRAISQFVEDRTGPFDGKEAGWVERKKSSAKKVSCTCTCAVRMSATKWSVHLNCAVYSPVACDTISAARPCDLIPRRRSTRAFG